MSKTIIGYTPYVTIEGDTFDGLALAMYNNEMLATDIMAANPDYYDVLIFEAGVSLRIPLLDMVDTPETLPPWRRGT